MAPSLKKEFGYANPMQVPRLDKIVINMGVGEAVSDRKTLDTRWPTSRRSPGRSRSSTKARKSIANFKLREGMPIGCKVTLRGERMYEFLDRLVNVALPRVRDFRGVSPKSFDGRGNYRSASGSRSSSPRSTTTRSTRSRGMDIIICTTAQTDDEARALLEGFGIPFRK